MLIFKAGEEGTQARKTAQANTESLKLTAHLGQEADHCAQSTQSSWGQIKDILGWQAGKSRLKFMSKGKEGLAGEGGEPCFTFSSPHWCYNPYAHVPNDQLRLRC